jgi:intracellular sulfur oxidation DsrE/DsrF family protein
MRNSRFSIGVLLLGLSLLPVSGAWAGAMGAAEHKLVIQVSTADAKTQKIAVNNAVNVQKAYGVDNVDVEIVAYGPGLSLLTTKSPQAERIASLAMQNIRFSACANTMAGIKKKTGKEPQLVQGVKVVPAGVGRIVELEEQGYAYIRP